MHIYSYIPNYAGQWKQQNLIYLVLESKYSLAPVISH